jgi:sensor histidine kinase YesM
VLWFGRRFSFEESRRAVDALAHIAFGLVCASAAALVDCVMAPRPGVTRQALFHIHSFDQLVSFPTGFHQDILAYWIVFGLQYTSRYYRRSREREQHALQLQLDEARLRAQLTDAELTSLRRQLRPELLYSAFDATTALVRGHQHRRAEDVLTALADLLRCALDDAHSGLVPLDCEFERVRAYLTLEQCRLHDRLRSRVTADPATLDAAVMAASIQPIIENALGLLVSQVEGTVELLIRSERVHDLLRIEIDCSTQATSGGVAFRDLDVHLEKTKSRLSQQYGGRFTLRVFHRAKGTAVTLLLPYERVTASAPSLTLHGTPMGLAGV